VKDFRSRVTHVSPTLADVEALLKDGQLTKALRKARAAGLTVPQEQVAAAATTMLRSGRAGELLSLVGTLAFSSRMTRQRCSDERSKLATTTRS
jgi:hypothetical protein